MRNNVFNIVFGISGVILILLFLQILAGKYSEQVGYVILWYLLAFVPNCIFFYKKKNQVNKNNYILILCYTIFVTLVFLAQPFYQAVFDTSFLFVLSVSCFLIIPYYIILFYSIKKQKIKNVPLPIKKNGWLNEADRNNLLKYLKGDKVEDFFRLISEIEKNNDMPDDFSDEISIIKTQWTEYKKRDVLKLDDTKTSLQAKSNIIYSLLKMLRNISMEND